MLLIQFQADYADEFNVYGFAVMSLEQWDHLVERVHVAFTQAAAAGESTETYFGTNEAIEWDSFSHWMRAFEIKEITDEEAATIKRLFGIKTYYGHFLTFGE